MFVAFFAPRVSEICENTAYVPIFGADKNATISSVATCNNNKKKEKKKKKNNTKKKKKKKNNTKKNNTNKKKKKLKKNTRKISTRRCVVGCLQAAV